MKRKQWRKIKRTILVTAGILLMALMLIALFFLLDRDHFRVRRNGSWDYWQLKLISASMQALTAAWIFAFAAAVGSFLNVVVWRMPRGETVVSRPSRCPYCDVNIQFRDNIPVFGWILLGGRCRACRLPISARYPIVEFIAGTLGLGLAFPELLSDAGNLPIAAYVRRSYVTWTIADIQLHFLGLFAFHGFLLAGLLSAALIHFDGRRVPRKMIALGVIVAVAAVAYWPDIHPVKWDSISTQVSTSSAWLKHFDTTLIGMLLGGAWAGAVSGFLAPPKGLSVSEFRWDVTLIGAVIGAFLGWQATSLSLAMALLIFAMTPVVCRNCYQRIPVLGCWLFTVYWHLLFWRQIDNTWSSLSPTSVWLATPSLIALGLILCVLSRRAFPVSVEPSDQLVAITPAAELSSDAKKHRVRKEEDEVDSSLNEGEEEQS